MFEGRAVQRECFILASLATHVAAKPVTQAAQQQLHLADGLAQMLVGVQANGSHLASSSSTYIGHMLLSCVAQSDVIIEQVYRVCCAAEHGGTVP
jgi:Tfp pilus assembly protein PilV